jgi:hypothetical protein
MLNLWNDVEPRMVGRVLGQNEEDVADACAFLYVNNEVARRKNRAPLPDGLVFA